MPIKILSGSLPQWDEQFRFTSYLRKDDQGNQTNHPYASRSREPYHAAFTGVAQQRRLGNLSVDDFLIVVAEAIKDNQGYHVSDPNGKAWRVQFPYARYMKKGDKIRNLTTNETYEVYHVLSPDTHDVLLSGQTPPVVTDRLRLTEDNEIHLTHGWPRSFVSSQKIDTTSDVADQPSSFNDTITFIVARSEPAGLGKAPFDTSARVLRPQFRESLVDPDDETSFITFEGQRFHSIVTFDCWARDNSRAADLLAYFEDFMFRAKWIFELWGLSKVFYWRRNEDQEVYRWRSDITKRTVEYMVETERLFFSKTTRMNDINVLVSLNFEPDTIDPLDVLTDDTLTWPEPSSNVVVSIETLGT